MTKRDKIIDAAVKEFAEYSYDAASINRIIKASGTSKGTFYHYFEDKKTLYFTIIEDLIRIKQEYFTRMSVYLQQNSDFFEMMKVQAKAALVLMREHPDFYRFGLKFTSEKQSLKDEFSEKYLSGIQDSFKKIVEEGIVSNNFSKRYPADFAARIIMYMSMNYFDILFDKGAKPSMEELETSLNMMYDFLKRGLS